MAYTPNVWSSADLVTAAKMNHIEDGIASSTARARTITVQTNQWILNNTTNMYEYTVSFENIDEASWIEVSLDNTIGNISEDIEWETSNESIVFSTAALPSGTVNIVVVAWGTIEGGAGSSAGIIKSEGIYPSYVGNLSNLDKNCIVSASNANDFPNNSSTTFTVVTQYTSSNEKAQIAFAPGGKEIYMRTTTNGTYSSWGLVGAEVVDNLNSNDATKALSAKQGKDLKNDLQGKMAIIIDGNSASSTIDANSYVIIQNNTNGIVNGLYKTKISIPTNITLSSSNQNDYLEAVTAGGLNSLNVGLASLNSQIITKIIQVTREMILLNGGVFWCEQSGNTVTISFENIVTSSSISTDTVIASIPASLAPGGRIFGIGKIINGDDLFFIVDAGGKISISGLTPIPAGNALYGSVTFVVDS